MLSIIVYLLPFALALGAIISLVIAVVNFRRGRSAPYFRLRRTAVNRAWRAVLAIVLFAGGAFAAVRLRQFVPPVDLDRLTASDTQATPLPAVDTPTGPAVEGSATTQPPLDAPTITPTQPTLTPTITPFIVTIDSPVTPPAEATLTISELASGISTNLSPVNPGTTFPAGTPRIYFWFAYENMVDGVSWTRVLLLDGEVVRSESSAWEYGVSGQNYDHFEAQGGWPSGRYAVRLFIGDRQAAEASFEIVN